MGKIYVSIKKNFKILFKSKLSLFLLLMAPIILTYIIGFFYFNANSFSLNIGIHSPDDSEFNTFFLEEIEKSQFNILQYNSITECETKLKSGLLHSCIYLPENFTIADNSKNSITLKLDTSKGEIIKISENLINDQLSKILTQIQIKQTQQLLDLINQSKNLILDTNLIYKNLTESNLNFKKANTQILDQVDKINTLYNPKNLNVGKLVLSSDNLNSSLYTLSKFGFIAANQSKGLIDNLSNDLENTTIKIDNLISDIKSNNVEVLKRLNTLENPYFFRQLNDLINDLYKKINSAEDSAGDINDNLDDDVSDISSQLNKINTQLEIYQNTNLNYLNKINNLKSTNAKSLITPISIKTTYLTPTSQSPLMNLFPSLIIGLVFIISLILSSMFVLIDKKNNGNFRTLLTNNSSINYLLSDFLTLFIVVFMQASLIISLYYFWFLKNFSLDFLIFIGLLSPVIMIFILLGMIIGFLSKSESTNVISVFVLIASFLSFSGKIIPIESLSESTIKFLSHNPLLVGESIIRKYLLFQIPISDLFSELFQLTIYILILFLICLILESFYKKNFLYKLYFELELLILNKLHKRK